MVDMSDRPAIPLTFCSLYESAVVGVRDYRCRSGRGGPAAEEHSDINHIVLVRHGAFCKHFGRRSVTADVNQAVFFSKGSTYRVSHPADCGDRDPSIDDRPERPFPFATGPCDSGVFWRHHQLVKRLEAAASDPLERLW